MSQPSCVQGQPEPLPECCLGHRRTASKQCCLTISLVRPELSSGLNLWLTIAQCLAAGSCALPLGTAAFFPHQPPSLRNWRLAAHWALLSWLRKGLTPSLMKEIVVFEVVYYCLFFTWYGHYKYMNTVADQMLCFSALSTHANSQHQSIGGFSESTD